MQGGARRRIQGASAGTEIRVPSPSSGHPLYRRPRGVQYRKGGAGSLSKYTTVPVALSIFSWEQSVGNHVLCYYCISQSLNMCAPGQSSNIGPFLGGQGQDHTSVNSSGLRSLTIQLDSELSNPEHRFFSH